MPSSSASPTLSHARWLPGADGALAPFLRRAGFTRLRPIEQRPCAPYRSRRGGFAGWPGIEEKEWRIEVQTREAPAKESFAALLDESLGVASSLEGTVVKGRVIAVENDAVLIDVGLKSEGRVPLKEFAAGGAQARSPCRRHRRGLSRADGGQERGGPAVAREGAPRGGLEPAGQELSRRTSGSPG